MGMPVAKSSGAVLCIFFMLQLSLSIRGMSFGIVSNLEWVILEQMLVAGSVLHGISRSQMCQKWVAHLLGRVLSVTSVSVSVMSL